MKKISYLVIITFIACLDAHAQNTIFLGRGKIEFERKENMYARLDDQTWLTPEIRANVKKNTQQFRTTYFDLSFNDSIMLYQPGRETEAYKGSFTLNVAQDNTVFTNLGNNQSTALKNIFEDKFLVQDSVRPIQWKLTNETRDIAGFECRRANAIILDSVYVVAFYTEAILTPGGPESFTGLPGMILGIALPHEHVTWFATKVFAETVPAATFKAPSGGKKLTNAALLKMMQEQMKSRGAEGSTYVKQAVL